MKFFLYFFRESSSCWQRRTLLEKLLIALCFLAAIAILALSLSLYLLNIRSERKYSNHFFRTLFFINRIQF